MEIKYSDFVQKLKGQPVYPYGYAVDLIKKYIKTTLNTEEQINEYVPNTHIAEVFRDILIYVELENMYKRKFHNFHMVHSETLENGVSREWDTKTPSYFHLLNILHLYFDKEKLETEGSENIHYVYQLLRQRDDYLRNMIKLINIDLKGVVMKHLVNRDLEAHKIKLV